MSAGEMGDEMTMQMLDALLGNLKEQNSLLANHPNAYIYNQLGAQHSSSTATSSSLSRSTRATSRSCRRSR